jgi:septum formation protein
MTLVLASQSSSRRALLTAAGVPHEALSPDVDEETEKLRLRAGGADAPALAIGLARYKAEELSRQRPGDLILGCDQTLSLSDGSTIDKATDPADAARILRRLSGDSHYLHSAAAILQAGEVKWSAIETVALKVRSLSDAFIADYLEREWDHVRWCVGCYRIEGPGVQLFAAINGTQFAIQGLPLIGLLDFLRQQGVLMA